VLFVQRIANLEAFRTGQPVKAPKQDSWEWEEESEEDEPTIAPILVASDLAARGLDLEVDLVVNFDFPKNPVDYLHRSGRTARNGAKGKVTSLVTSRDRVLADQIRDAISRGESLEQLSSNKVVAEGMKKKRIEENRKEKERAAGLTPVGKPKKVLVAPLTVRGRKTPPGRGGGIGVAKKVEQTRTAKNRGGDDKRPPVIPKGTRGAARAVAMGKPVEYKSQSRFARSAARR
jgi:superfamily II DNA/RNA helicase